MRLRLLFLLPRHKYLALLSLLRLVLGPQVRLLRNCLKSLRLRSGLAWA
eukprot:COSAG02_NODE_46975_length_344_cov_1.567347_1_plen_48_part_10